MQGRRSADASGQPEPTPLSGARGDESAAAVAAPRRLRAPGIPLEYASPEEQAFREATFPRLPMSAP
jgi:hypothetical protein